MFATHKTQVYTGSQLFRPLSEYIGQPLDQVNHVVVHVFGLVFAIFFRKVLSYQKVSVEIRHYFSLAVGIVLGYFFVGKELYHLFVVTTLSYTALVTCNPHYVQKVVLFISFTHLLYLHLNRLLNENQDYTLDVTGPMMIAVQRVTNVGFSLNDGLTKSDEELTADRKRDAIRKVPTILEYYSYLFNFTTLICGPLVFYNEYLDFISGQNFEKHRKTTAKLNEISSPKWPVLKKLTISSMFCLLHCFVDPFFPFNRFKDNRYLSETPFLSKIIYLYLSTFVIRFKYYHGFMLGESVCNTAGLGFNGFKPDGRPDWSLMSNFDIFDFENSLNLKILFECWNKRTQIWLRKSAYERNHRNKLFWTYLLSSLWHGLHPGYFLTFFHFAVFTIAARNVRRSIRPIFQQKGRALAFTYDCLTYLATRITLAYMTIPFNLLEFWPSIKVYTHLYFFGYILALVAVFILPKLLLPKPRSDKVHKQHQQ